MERAEKIGLGVAAGGHALLFGLLSLGALTPTPDAFKPKPVEVSLIGETAPEAAAPTVSDEAPAPASAPEVAPPSETPPPAPMERVVEPRPEAAPPRPVERTPPKPVEKPTPVKPTPVKKVTPKPVEKPAPKTTPPKKAAPKPTPAKPAAQPQKPAAKPATQPPRQSRLGKDFLKGVPTESGGTAAQPTAKKASATVKKSIDVSISGEIKPFWQKNAPSGVDIEQLVTIVQLRLAEDGTLAAAPKCIRQTGKTDSNAPQAPLHCERAIKAARLAAPFKLPADYYDDWKTWEVTFRTR